MAKNNTSNFSNLLNTLITISNQKSYALANHLGYDVSYISKWMGGSAYPARKNIDEISSHIAEFFVQGNDQTSLDKLFTMYHTQDIEELALAIKKDLIVAYNEPKSNSSKDIKLFTEQGYNSTFIINPRLQSVSLKTHPLNTQDSNEIILLCDFFALGKEDKLSLAGFDNVSSTNKDINPNMKLNILLAIDKNNIHPIFDTILFINMLTNYSKFKEFNLLYVEKTPVSLLLAIKNQYVHMSLITDNHRCIASNTSVDKKVVNEMYDTLLSMQHTQSSSLAIKTPIQDLVNEQKYLESVILPDQRWLIGKLSEHFVPNDLFLQIAKKIYDEGSEEFKNLTKVHMMLNASINISKIKIAIYENAINECILNGEIDFYGHKVILDLKQRVSLFAYIKEIIENNVNLDVKIINGNLNIEFKKNDNPSIYMAEHFYLVRINNDDTHCGYLIKTKDMADIFDSFYDELWSIDSELITSKRDFILEKMDNYLNTFKLLNNVNHKMDG